MYYYVQSQELDYYRTTIPYVVSIPLTVLYGSASFVHSFFYEEVNAKRCHCTDLSISSVVIVQK